MSICVVDGKQCRCQPEDAVPCPGVMELRARIVELERALRYWLPDETCILAGHEIAWNEHVQLIPEHRLTAGKR